MKDFLYHYKAVVTNVYDGDTITADIDLGFGIVMHKQKIRLLGIDTPEIRGEERNEGLRVRDWLRSKILLKEITLQTYKDKSGKYGRWLGVIYLGELNMNAQLIAEGLAEVYK